MDRLISEQAVLNAIYNSYGVLEAINAIRAIPPAESKILQKSLKCREAHCGAMCSPIIAESYCENPKKCEFYERINDETILLADKWIPVTEKLPKDNGWYRCTIIINDLPQTMELFYKNGKWLDNRRIDMFYTYDIYGYGNTTEKHKLSYKELISQFEWTKNVIAWMPLPEPYKPQENEG